MPQLAAVSAQSNHMVRNTEQALASPYRTCLTVALWQQASDMSNAPNRIQENG